MTNIINFDNINNIVKDEKLNICVISFGGSCSNELVKTLEKNNYICKTMTWRKILCHCPEYIKLDIPIIYIYDNPIKAFLSMKRRGKGYWDTNQRKLSNNPNIELSDENLLTLMIKQFNTWTQNKDSNVLVIKSCELFDNSIVDKLKTFLKNDKIIEFPIVYRTPVTKLDSINDIDAKLFFKYKTEIERINNYKS